jgi:pimeloyl-ACP methyl ester carboxylesterase
MRSAELTTDDFDQALQSAGITSMETIELAGTSEVPARGALTRSTTFGEPAIELEAPDPGEKWGQVVLYKDESGVTTWNFARDVDNEVVPTRSRGTRTYVIRRRVTVPGGVVETRGLLGALGTKVLKVLVFPLVDPVVGEVGKFFASRWEAKHRAYRIRSFTPDNYRSSDPDLVGGPFWDNLAEGRALLMVHGAFSRARSAFGGFPARSVQALCQRYNGRVFAFEHPTISEDPSANVDWLLQNMPADASLDLDIICHSRGGLVSRVLAERQGELQMGARSVSVRRVVFVASPNAGTILADAKYLGDMVDSYTNLLNFFPDNGVIDVLEGAIAVVKQLAMAAFEGLEGLQSMLPGGSYLAGLNSGPAIPNTRYYALASNFEPQPGGLRDYAKDFLLDKIFKADNDLVVPTGGVFAENGSGQFPIGDRFVFDASESVQHGGFFANDVARGKIMEWLTQ